MRRIAIGDIHGCAKALRTLIESIQPAQNDELIFVGDYIDRGPDSRNVVDQILELSQRCRVVTLRGNHEIMLQGVALNGLDDRVWLANGGQATVTSYGGNLAKIPEDHLMFFQGLQPFYETQADIFVHAGYLPQVAMRSQADMELYWAHLSSPLPLPHHSGKRVIVGHTPQPEGRVLDAGHLVCIDTYCFGGGYLTAMDMESGQLIQTDRHGHVRRPPLLSAVHHVNKLGRAVTRFCRQQLDRETNSQPIQVAPRSLANEPEGT